MLKFLVIFVCIILAFLIGDISCQNEEYSEGDGTSIGFKTFVAFIVIVAAVGLAILLRPWLSSSLLDGITTRSYQPV